MGLFFFLGLQAFRVYTFLGGIRRGFSFLSELKRWDLINWGRRIKFVNAALLLCLWTLLFPAGNAATWGWGMGALALAGVLSLRPLLPRWVVAGVVLAVLTAIPWLMQHAADLPPVGMP
jgi:PTS system mannose-specific IID component